MTDASPVAAVTPPSTQYDYVQVAAPPLSVDDLDKMAVSIISTPVTGIPGMVFMSLKLLVLGIYLFAREKLIAQQQMVLKQQNEQERATHDQGVVDNAAPGK